MTGLLSRSFGAPLAWRRQVPAVAAAAAIGVLLAGTPAAAAPAVAASSSAAQPVAVAASAASAGGLTAPDAVSAAAIARLEDAPVEVLGERTESGSVFALPDGTMASGQGSGPVWVRRGGDGTKAEDWAAVDLSLQLGSDGQVRPVAQSAGLVLSGGTVAASPAASAGGAVELTAARVEVSPSSSPSPLDPSGPATPTSTPTPAPTTSASPGSTNEPSPSASADTAPAVEASPTPTPTPTVSPDAPMQVAPSSQIAEVTDPASGVITRVQWEGSLPAPRLEGRRATYVDVKPGVDLVLEATSTGFEQFFVIKSRPAPGAKMSLPMTVSTDGAEIAVADDGSLSVRTAAGEVAADAPVPFMWDAASDAGRAFPVTEARPAESADAPRLSPMPNFASKSASGKGVTLPGGARTNPLETLRGAESNAAPAPAAQPVGDGRIDPMRDAVEVARDVHLSKAHEAVVSLQPQDDFLQAADTVYPVVVDPDVNLNWGFDTYVLKGYSNDRSGQTELDIGTYDGGTHVGRAFIHFPMGQFAGKTVYSARMELFNYYSWSCQARNWQVWNVFPASAGTVWANQPGWATHYSTSSETHGYSSSCGGSWSNADVTAFAQMWAASNETEGHVGVKAESETDNYGWKRFYSANNGAYIPSIWVNYNSTPNTPTGLQISNATTPTVSGAWVNTLTPTLSATISDPDGGSVNGNFWAQRGDNGTVVFRGAANYLANGAVGSVQVAAGALTNNTVYAWSVTGSDNIVDGPQAPWFWFGVDTTAPLAPTVASTSYPNNNTWNLDAGQAGTFTLQPALDDSLTKFIWALDKAPDPNQSVAASTTGAATALSVTPPTTGRHVLQVQTIDRAGNPSGIVKYAFNVGRAGILTPEDGARVVRRTRVVVTGQPGFTNVRFQWRRGPDSPDAEVAAVASAALSTSSGVSWSTAAPSGWAPLPTGNAYTTWDVGTTLGFSGGPVQVRALVAQNAAGLGQYATAWVTVTLDPNATGAATAAVGPGAVNLLTGDHTLSVSDVEEFGVGLERAASSRDTDAGLQLQADKLSVDQREAQSLAGIAAGSTTVTVDTARHHTGTSSFRVAASPSTTDSYVALGGDAGALQLGMRPGRTYRVSGWVLVPAASGLTPANARGLSLAVFTRIGAGAYSEPAGTSAITPRPTVTDAWTQVSTDVTIPVGSTEAFVRLYNGLAAGSTGAVYFDDLSVREVWSPFGKEWSTGTADAATGTAYTRVTRPYDDVVAVQLTGGGEIWFTSGDGVKWWPEPGSEDLKLTPVGSASAPSGWRLSEIDGTTTDFVRDTVSGDFPVTVTSPPQAAGAAVSQARHVYSTVLDDVGKPAISRLWRIIAPIEDGVDGWPANLNACNPSPGVVPARGCELVELSYASATTATASTPGSFAGQVQAASVWSTDPATGVVAAVEVARYLYGATGQLLRVWDPRIGTTAAGLPGAGTQVTSYAYDAAGRVTSVTAPGEEPFRFTYGKAGASYSSTGDFIDPSLGRLLQVSRRSLVPGTASSWGPDNVSTIVYNVPLSRAAGGPYDLGDAALATWAQTDGPSDATAVFGPEAPPPVTTATLSTPGSGGFAPASVHYLNSSGQEVNTASPAGLNAPVEGFIDTAEYDRFGNVIRTLDATNRLLALGKLPESAALASWGLGGSGSVYLSQVLDTRTAYSADGLDVVATRGPAQRLAVANDADTVVTMHPATRYAYDEGKPDGVAYHLVTRTRSGGLAIGADMTTATYSDSIVTTNTYNPIDGKAATDPSSGWVHKQPTSVTVDSETAGGSLTSTVLYDAHGRPVRSSKPGSTGSDAATTLSLFYVAGTDPANEGCGGRPEWAGQPCLVKAAGPITGLDATRMAGAVSRKRVEAYNRYGSPISVAESAQGPVNGATSTVGRRTVTEYDSADRVTWVEISGTGAGTGAAIARTTTIYDAVTGEVTATQSVDSTGAVTALISKEFDALGRITKYTDAKGAATATTYDRYGKPSSTTESVTDALGTRSIGSTTYTYDRTLDPRGLLTSFTDSVAGTISATWGPDGQLDSELLPGDVKLTIGYDPARVPVGRTYTRASDGVVIAADSVLENQRGQWVRHTSTTGVRDYDYDRLGRLTLVEDRLAGAASCTARGYGFDTHANRTRFATASLATATASDPCATVDVAAGQLSTYDSADRLVTSPAGAGWAYDPWGRITSMTESTGTGSVSNAFYVNDLVASQEVAGVARMSWALDPIQRRSVATTDAWVNGAWASSASKVSHFASDSDEPSWVQEDATLPSAVTRYVSGVEGDVAVTTSLTGDRVLQLVDLHGDIIGTVPIADGATGATWSGLAFASFDEFGAPQQLTGGSAATGPPARYGWLGAAQRSAETLGGLVLMGVRLYSAAIGRFLSVDPVPGGSASAYDYCNADPVNCSDLGGTFSWKGALKVLAVVGEVASFIPGPIGAGAAAVSSVAYLALGDKGKALEMGITAAAQLVGAGVGVRAGFKAANAARKIGQAVERAAPKLARAAGKAKAAVAAVVKRGCNSFEPDTPVLMGDGTSDPIVDVAVGDLVLATDPVTGLTTPKPVTDLIRYLAVHTWVDLTIVTEAGAETIAATDKHPFYVDRHAWIPAGIAIAPAREWVQAIDLRVGDALTTLDGTTAVVASTATRTSTDWAYNLTVADTHTYYVGDAPVLVHNNGTCSVPFNGNQRAVISLAKSKKRGIAEDDAKTLWEWAREYKVPHSHKPDLHAPRTTQSRPMGRHVKINGMHIPIVG